MSIYKIDAEYNADGPVLNSPDADDFPARLQIGTSDSFSELRLDRDEYDDVLEAVETAMEEGAEKCDLEEGSFAMRGARPVGDDDWEVEVWRNGLGFEFMLMDDEAERLEALLKLVHPKYDVDPNEHEKLEAEA